MSLAEYEYEVHSSVDVFEDLGHVGERLKSMAESIQLVDKNELKNYPIGYLMLEKFKERAIEVHGYRLAGKY